MSEDCRQLWWLTDARTRGRPLSRPLPPPPPTRGPRLLCWTMTSPASLHTRAALVNSTWGRQCHHLLFMAPSPLAGAARRPFQACVPLFRSHQIPARNALPPKASILCSCHCRRQKTAICFGTRPSWLGCTCCEFYCFWSATTTAADRHMIRPFSAATTTWTRPTGSSVPTTTAL